MKKIIVFLVLALLVATFSFGSYFNSNNVGGSVIYFPFLLGIYSVSGYYRLGFEIFGPSRTGGLSFTPTMLYVGPTISYSGALGGVAEIEAGLDARLLTGLENISFRFFGRRYMLALGVRGQAIYSFYDGKFDTRISPEISFIDVTKMTDRFKYSLFFWPLPVLLGFDLYF